MLLDHRIINKLMKKRGFAYRRSDKNFTIHGEYARNLQIVYSKTYRTKEGRIEDLVYFGVDLLSESFVIGMYRENIDMDDGIYINTSASIPQVLFHKFNADEIDRVLTKLITPLNDTL